MKKRILLTLSFGLMAAVSFGQSLGTKPDVVAKPPATDQAMVQPMDIAQMLGAVLIVGAILKWVLPKVVSKLGKRLSTAVGSSIHIEESASFGAGQLQIVKVRERTLLLCVTAQGVTCLSDLTEQQIQAVPSKAFVDFLDDADPTKAVDSTEPTPEPVGASGMSMDDAMNLIANAQSRILGKPIETSPLDRLNRLTGSQ